MKRRTILQAISAFLASFLAYWGLGRKPELAPNWLPPTPKLPPTGPIGPISTNAQWFSPPTYEVVPTINQELFKNRLERLATMSEEARQRTYPDIELQEGYEVMRLKNPAIRRTVMGVDYAKRPPEQYVSPSGPVARANTDAWQPLETFQPLPHHPELASAGVVLGTFHRPATAARLDVSNDTEYLVAAGKRLGDASWVSKLPPPPVPTEEEQARMAQIRAKQEANYVELEANWDAQAFDPTDVDRAREATRPLSVERTEAFNTWWDSLPKTS